MAYRLVLHKKAQKGLKALQNQPALLKKIDRFYDELGKNPLSIPAKRLKGEWDGCFSYRTGPIRIIYEIYEHTLVIYVLDVGPRGDIY